MSFPSCSIGGKEYDFTHLEPFRLTIPDGFGGRDLRVRVAAGCHVFTREWEDGDDEAFRYMDGATARFFCTQRYHHSLQLKAMINTASQGEAFFSTNKKFVFNAVLPGLPGPYVIAFKVAKPRKTRYFDVMMDVVSAHARLRMPTLKPITFQKIVTLTASGKTIEWPKR